LKAPIDESRDFGIMLYDMDFEGNTEKPEAMFYRALIEHGVIVVPPINSKEVLR
jgi:CRISPR-associated protein Cas5d